MDDFVSLRTAMKYYDNLAKRKSRLKLKVQDFCIDESWQLVIEFSLLFNLKTIYIECFFKAFFAVPCPTFASHSEDIVAETRVERKRRGVSSGIK